MSVADGNVRYVALTSIGGGDTPCVAIRPIS